MAESKQTDNDVQVVQEPIPRIRQENVTLDWEGIRSEELLQLKKSRSAKKGIITKVQNDVRSLMLDFANVDLVKSKLQELKGIVEDFNNAHAVYHEQLVDERDIEESNQYFDAVKLSTSDLAGEIANWIISSENASPKDSIINVTSRANSKLSRHSKSSSIFSVSSAKAKSAAKEQC